MFPPLDAKNFKIADIFTVEIEPEVIPCFGQTLNFET